LILGLLKRFKILALCSQVMKKVLTRWTQQLCNSTTTRKYRLQFKNICVCSRFHTYSYVYECQQFTFYL